ncbi:MAG: glycosyltransferase [Bacteroidales bacterium]|nr:glycosyltransferase [Bacteroidales bacterium]
MINEKCFEYSAVIRTLGRAGDKYKSLLDSLNNQSVKPKEIIVYIAEGYPLPKETIGKEKYVYVKKGMVAQRALQYEEVSTDYILFLDDDLLLQDSSVESMYTLLKKNNADVISPDIFPNAKRNKLSELMMTISGRMRARRNDGLWGYKVMRTTGYSYNSSPDKDVYWSQTNAGACFLCKKEDFIKIHFEEELWLDNVSYPIGEDQAMYYKMYRRGLKLLTWYNHNIQHLDAGMNMLKDKQLKLVFSDFRFKVIFWHRFIYKPEKKMLSNILNILSISYFLFFSLTISLLKLQFDVFEIKVDGLKSAIQYMKTDSYKKLTVI